MFGLFKSINGVSRVWGWTGNHGKPQRLDGLFKKDRWDPQGPWLLKLAIFSIIIIYFRGNSGFVWGIVETLSYLSCKSSRSSLLTMK